MTGGAVARVARIEATETAPIAARTIGIGTFGDPPVSHELEIKMPTMSRLDAKPGNAPRAAVDGAGGATAAVDGLRSRSMPVATRRAWTRSP